MTMEGLEDGSAAAPGESFDMFAMQVRASSASA